MKPYAKKTYLNSFISQGLIAPYCCPPGKLTTRKLLKVIGAIPASYPDKSYFGIFVLFIHIYFSTNSNAATCIAGMVIQ